MRENILNKFKEFFTVNNLILFLYTVFILSMQQLISVGDNSLVFRGLISSIYVSLIVCPIILHYFGKFDFSILFEHDKKSNYLFKLLYFLIPFIILLITYIGFYPGGFWTDNLYQYEQAVTGNYNDWHPAIQTLLSYTLPLFLTNGWIGSIVLFQIIEISLALWYSLCAIEKISNRRVAIIAMLVTTLNPNVISLSMYAFKDVTFAICTLLLMTFLLKIISSKGQWIKKPLNIIVLSLIVAVTTLIRLNGILFTIPFVIAVVLNSNKKCFLIILALIITFTAIVKGPIYSVLKVGPIPNRQMEVVGLPMSILGEFVSKNPKLLSKETLKFAYAIAQKEIWENDYLYGFQSIKFRTETDLELLQTVDKKIFFDILVECFVKSPIEFFRAFAFSTYTTYSIFNCTHLIFPPSTDANDFGIMKESTNLIQELYSGYTEVMNSFFPHIFIYTGAWIYLLLIAVLSKYKLNSKDDWKRIIIIFPLCCYNFGTMFLLTGTLDTMRYFIYTFFIAPIMLLTLLMPKEEMT